MTLLFQYMKIFDELEKDGPLVGEGDRRSNACWNTLMCCLGSLAMKRRIELFSSLEAIDFGG